MTDDQQTIFDIEAGARARDEALKRVEDHAEPDWKEAAYTALCACAMTYPGGFISDDVYAFLPEDVPPPHEPRAMGPVFMRAKKAGIIAPTNYFRPSARVSTHKSPRRVWVAT